jgi:hypothetical protein
MGEFGMIALVAPRRENKNVLKKTNTLTYAWFPMAKYQRQWQHLPFARPYATISVPSPSAIQGQAKKKKKSKEKTKENQKHAKKHRRARRLAGGATTAPRSVGKGKECRQPAAAATSRSSTVWLASRTSPPTSTPNPDYTSSPPMPCAREENAAGKQLGTTLLRLCANTPRRRWACTGCNALVAAPCASPWHSVSLSHALLLLLLHQLAGVPTEIAYLQNAIDH